MAIQRVSRAASIPAWALALMLAFAPAARAATVTLLRDAGIEHGLAMLAFPIFRAAGLRPSRMRVLVVDDDAMNAFVVDNRTIYLHSGMIAKARSPAMLQAVIAHETAHIANGHLARRMANLRSARTAAGLGMALGVVTALAGGGDAGSAIALGSASAAQRAFFAHTRAEEAAADRSAAGYLRFAGVSIRGLVDLHQTFQGQELLNRNRQDPYTQSHPLTADRIRVARDLLASEDPNLPPRPGDDYWFARLKGKLTAFQRAPKWTLRRTETETFDDIRLMRQAVAMHRLGRMQAALAAIDGALAVRPEDAWYLDLKAQIEMENRRFAAAIDTYRAAVALAPREALILGGLGRALLAADRPKAALATLKQARDRDFRDTRILRDLAQAYARNGRNGEAALATAERYALTGDNDGAVVQARRALALLPEGSPSWQRAQDVLDATRQSSKGNR